MRFLYTRRSTLRFAFLLCVAGLTIVFGLGDVIASQTMTVVKSFRSGDLVYRGPSSRVYRHTERGYHEFERFRASLSFYPNRIQYFDNLFQTGPENSGLRLELSRPRTLAVIAAANVAGGYVAYIITTKLGLKRWHSFHMTIDDHNHVVIVFDGKVRFDETNPGLEYRLSDIRLGTGMDGTRPFHGRISHASFAITFLGIDATARAVIEGLRMLFEGGIIVTLLVALLSYDGAPVRESTAGVAGFLNTWEFGETWK